MLRTIIVYTRKSLMVAVSVVTMSTAIALPAISQEAETEEPKSVLVNSTIVGDADPSKAITVSDLTIPPDQLALLVKPLTLEELQTESAAWFLLLKNKVQEISTAEVAIKQKNALIAQEEEAAKAVEAAKTKLTEAQSKLEAAQTGTPEHDQATQDLEDAKTALLDAEKAVEAVTTATADLEDDENVKEAIAEAESAEEISQAKAVLEEAEKTRDELEAGSTDYQDATEKIDALTVAIRDLETAEEELTTEVPDSPEYLEVEKKVNDLRTQAIAASGAVLEAGLAPTIATKQSGIESEEADDALDAVAEDVESNSEDAVKADGESTDGETSAQDDAEEAGEAAEQLEGIDKTLENVAEAEADLKNQLVENVTQLQGERTDLVERFQVVLDALEKKGGDATSYRLYIDAVSGIELDLQDTEGLGVRIVGWITSEQGGLRLGLGILQFVAIVGASVIAANIIAKTIERLLSKLDGTSSLLKGFVVMITKRGVVVIGTLLALTSLGVSLGPVLALVGGASFVIAFALQSNLGNFASGLMLILNKPFDVGDEVKVAGYWGTVESISLASTRIRDFSKHLISLPNNMVWGGDILNMTYADVRKASFPLRLPASVDLNEVLALWVEFASAHPKVLDNPAPGYFPGNFGAEYDYYISASFTAWTKTEDFWATFVDLLVGFFPLLEKNGIKLAGPQLMTFEPPKDVPAEVAAQVAQLQGQPAE